MELHPSYLEEDGRKVFAVLRIDEFESLTARLEDLEDLVDLREARRDPDNAEMVDVVDLRVAVEHERSKITCPR